MERAFKVGCRVIFFDSTRQAHEAVVTNWFHGGPDGQTMDEWRALPGHGSYTPCCNLVYVSDDKSETDPYGRQLKRQTSCSNGRNQSTPFLGVCWAWPDEEAEARELAAKAYAEAVAK